MRKILALALAGLLTAPPASAAQKPSAPIDWQKVQELSAGTNIVLKVTGRPPAKARVLFAGDTVLVTLKPSAPQLSGRVQLALLRPGRMWPATINAGGEYILDKVRVSGEGIFDGDRKVADLEQVVEQTPRSDVEGLSETRPGSPIDWEKAQTVKAGTKIGLTVTGLAPAKVRLLLATDAILITLKPNAPQLSDRVQLALLKPGRMWPAIINAGGEYVFDEVRVSGEGIFDGDQRVADLWDVVQQTPPAEVLEISTLCSWWSRNMDWVVSAGTLGLFLIYLPIYLAGNTGHP